LQLVGLLGEKQETETNREKHDKRAKGNEKSLQIIMFFDERSEEFCSVVFRIPTKALPLF
jgi:hypothetical protein